MLKNMRLSYKLIGGFVFILILTAIIAYIGITSAISINSRVEKADDMNRLVKSALQMGDARKTFTNTGDKQYADEAANCADEMLKLANELNNKLIIVDDKQRMSEIINQIGLYKPLLSDYITQQGNIKTINKESQPAEYNSAAQEIKRLENEMRNVQVKITNTCEEGRASQKELMQREMMANRNLIIVFSLTAMILGLSLAIILTRGITKPINFVAEALNENAAQVASASEQLSATSQQLAEGSSEQAASIEETSSTLEEASSMIQQNSENTKQAAVLAGQAKASADKGNAEMRDMMESMEEIKKSSDQIAKIIKVIDDIAFQTNILALNAAVEAARAGDAGMGFAVVAEEVRNLAQRSAQAAKDTAAIIERNIDMSEQGVSISKMVAESLGEITLQSKKVNELMDEIAAASQEQTQGMMQINKAIAQMEKVTQQNAANAEESASASEELSAQAVSMKDVVGQLIKLVKGNTDVNTSDKQLSAKTGSLRTAEHGSRAFGKLPSGEAGTKRTSRSVTAKHGAKTREINPEEVIPLEEDTESF